MEGGAIAYVVENYQISGMNVFLIYIILEYIVLSSDLESQHGWMLKHSFI